MTNQKKQAETTKIPLNSQTSLNRLHREVYQRVSKMSARQGFQTLVDSGIYTANGNLRKRYGG